MVLMEVGDQPVIRQGLCGQKHLSLWDSDDLANQGGYWGLLR